MSFTVSGVRRAMKAGALKKVDAHLFEQQAEEHYVEPRWCPQQLFSCVPFVGAIHDPACGFGRIPEAAHAAGLHATASDIVDRGFPGVYVEDFLACVERDRFENIVSNPPFKLGRNFIEIGLEAVTHKVAVILPVRRLNAAGAWLRKLPLQKVLYLTPRPSMPPGTVVRELEAAGKEPSGGKQDFCWLVFNKHKESGREPSVGWLHRDRGLL